MDIKVNELVMPNVADTAAVKEKQADEDFFFTLDKIGNKDLEERLARLMEDIAAQGKKLADHMDISDLRRYRTLVTQFMNEVVSNSHKFSRENFLDRRGRHRVYGIVKLVDKNLDELAQDLLKQEKSHLSILNRVDEIRGLLLDMIV